MAAGVGSSMVRISWFGFGFFGRGFESRAANGSAFFAFCCAVHSTSRVLLFLTKAIEGDILTGPFECPDQRFGREIVLRRRAMYRARATPTSHFGASETISARKFAFRAYFERRALAKTSSATPLSGWNTREFAALLKDRISCYSAKYAILGCFSLLTPGGCTVNFGDFGCAAKGS